MKCVKCNTEQPESNFYKRPNRIGKFQSYCKKCNHANVLERQRKFKLKCIEYLGGKCQRCGYNKYIGALEFHHLDPKQKDFEVSKLKLTSWNKNSAIILNELDKCELVCSNCHREIHGKND